MRPFPESTEFRLSKISAFVLQKCICFTEVPMICLWKCKQIRSTGCYAHFGSDQCTQGTKSNPLPVLKVLYFDVPFAGAPYVLFLRFVLDAKSDLGGFERRDRMKLEDLHPIGLETSSEPSLRNRFFVGALDYFSRDQL